MKQLMKALTALTLVCLLLTGGMTMAEEDFGTPVDDLSYLFTQTPIADSSLIDPDTVMRVAFTHDMEAMHPTLLFDFTIGISYEDSYNFLAEASTAAYRFAMTDEYRAAALDILRNGDWDCVAPDTEVYDQGWIVAVETPQGIVRYTLLGEQTNGISDIGMALLRLSWTVTDE